MSNKSQDNDSTPSSTKKEGERDGDVVLTIASSSNTADAIPVVENAKKKRSAGNQLTKDDFDAGENSNDDDEEIIEQGFKRASDDVLKNRKIYKIKRTVQPAVAGTAASTKGSTLTDTDKTAGSKTDVTQPTSSTNSSNPFAATTLVAKENSNGESEGDGGEQKKNPFASTSFASTNTTSCTSNGTSPSNKKEFGFGSGGYSGFGSTKSVTSTSDGTKGFKGSGFTGGFAGIGSSASTGKPSGFVPATGNAMGWFGGTTSNASGPPVKFNLKSNDTPTDGENSNVAAQLPANVELTTGEEDEKVIHEGRCKSFVWVLDNKDETKHLTGSDEATDGISSFTSSTGKANLSVKPSTEFQAVISSNKTDKDETTTTTKVEVSSSSNEDEKEDQNDDSIGTNNENKVDEGEDKEDTTTEKDDNDATTSSSLESQKHRWQELGIGPMKILRSTKKPDRFRLVQRRESSKNGPATKVILNVPLWKETTCERDRQAQQYLRLQTFENGKVCTYSFLFKENTDAGFFQHYMTDHIPDARKCFTVSVATALVE
mmetsp:Transcript_31558/g.36262  ORF Transcript_31558/g.36262 Transcript_31558/m.36262 type:complete len:544 (+) Transcript_31558:58-1689(+)